MKTDLIICVWAWGASKPNDKKSGSEAGSVHNRLSEEQIQHVSPVNEFSKNDTWFQALAKAYYVYISTYFYR